MITVGERRYEVVLANQFYLRELVEGITLEETLDEVSYCGKVRLVWVPGLTIAPGQEIRISGTPFGSDQMVYLLHPGVVWEITSKTSGQKHLEVTVYDRTIYLAKSEDEYLFPEGTTATQRISRIASDWGIPIAKLEETGIPLAKAVYRKQTLWQMIKSSLEETVKKGGDMFRLRMTPYGLELVKLGQNATVWVLEPEANIEELEQKRTLEGTVTQVKVLGNTTDDQASPVLAMATGETAKYGTLQKVIADPQMTDQGQAQAAAQSALCGVQETFTVTSVDINTIRAGDKVVLAGIETLVMSVRHELGSPGKMTLELAYPDYIRRKVYGYGSV